MQTRITDYIPGLNPTDRRLICDPTAKELGSEVTVAESLQKHGYQTFYSGKWHLGTGISGPKSEGYEVVVEDASLGNSGKDPLVGDRVTESALKFLDSHDHARPFFMFLGYHEPHTPLLPHPRHIARFEAAAAKLPKVEPTTKPEHDGITRLVQDDPVYASEIAVLDEAVQKLDAKLAALNLTDNTVVVFTSDNGGLSTRSKPGSTSDLPLRAGKGWLYEGGIRVPLIVRAPGVTKPGQTCHSPVISMDFFPTFLSLAGVESEWFRHIGGRNISHLLKGEEEPDRSLYWHYPHYHGSMWAPGSAIREGDWKLIEFFDPPAVELYNLREDLGEQHDLAAAQPEIVTRLREELDKARKHYSAAMPRVNENFVDKAKTPSK